MLLDADAHVRIFGPAAPTHPIQRHRYTANDDSGDSIFGIDVSGTHSSGVDATIRERRPHAIF